MQDFDLVIRNGTVIDGSGGDPIEADVGLRNGRIAVVGHVSGSGREEIEVRGHIVTPGFVDIHTHYDGQITWAITRSGAISTHCSCAIMSGSGWSTERSSPGGERTARSRTIPI